MRATSHASLCSRRQFLSGCACRAGCAAAGLLLRPRPTFAAVSAGMVKPVDWLKAQTAPQFAPHSTLPPLTRWGWAMSFDVAKELADRWGYAVEFSGYVSEAVADEALRNPDGRNGRCLALVADNPQKYKLGVLVDRQFPKEMPPEAYLRDAQGNFISDKNVPKMLSPEMPEECLNEAGQLHAVGLAKLRARCPIAIIQNGGEYGLNVIGWAKKYWEQDPRVVAAKGNRGWYQYISRQKAREQKAIADAIRAALPGRLLYVFYTCGGDTHRHGTVETFHNDWAWDYADMRACADIATSEYYYHDFNSGWIGPDNMLTQALGAKGYELRFNMKNSYDYVCPGYKQDEKAGAAPVWDPTQPIDNNAKAFGDLRLYEGFLKCLYTEGMIGAVAGYFSFPPGGFDAAFSPDKPPQYLVQMVILGRVHALFSHHEAFLRRGDLLPGPEKHAKVKDQPAYEFPAGRPTLRILARKMPNEPQWLITAWASDGVDGPATVEIPELGKITVQARAIATVYTATLQSGKPVLQQADL
ncbi:MAG: hypothetical protein HUU20_12500 [Pirellulales bacterium]|nr:hypothetical protein [Pirellulales bacterium]